MKKKIISLLLAALFLLSACGKEKEARITIIARDGPAGPGPSVALPEKRAASDRVLQYIEGGPLDDFAPSADYGLAIPYVVGSWRWMYGFADAKGRIICEPVYMSVMEWEYEGKTAWQAQRWLGTEDTRLATRLSSDYYGDDYLFMDRTAFVIGGDGSWAVFTDGVLNPWNDFRGGERYISIQRNGLWGCVNYDGEEIIPCQYKTKLNFQDGLACVEEDGDVFEPVYLEQAKDVLEGYALPKGRKTARYSYINEKNEKVLGPFTANTEGRSLAAYHFANGLAPFYENGQFGLMDTKGNVALQAAYSTLEEACARGGAFLEDSGYPGKVNNNTNTATLADGREIQFPDAQFMSAGYYGYYVETADSTSVYDWAGRLLAEGLPNQYMTWLDEGHLAIENHDWKNMGVQVYSLEKKAYLWSGEAMERVFYSCSGLFSVWKDGYTGIVNTDGEWLMKRPMTDFEMVD